MDQPCPDLSIEFSKNPLLCPICHDYYTEPCILSCYHTFCSRCLRGRELDRKLICPFCRHPTSLKDGLNLPPPDTLMRQLIDIANSENPPCSNCDKRDRSNMYYCNTCCQALCSHCRDNTHRAKMFSAHEVVHMTRCAKEPKRCPQHGEQYIMYSPMQHSMLCVNCFRDTPNEIRAQCLDIDTAHTQAAKRLERGQNAIMDLQTSVRDGIIALKGLMDELRRNMDTEKHTINTFCQGMQEAIAKTHASMIMEVQRQFESKDRVYRSQLLVLGTVMPVLQLHLVLCTTFTSAANKYQFLELCPQLIERLSAVGNLSQPVRSLQSSSIKTNYRSEFSQSLEPWIGPTAVNQHIAEIAASSKVYDTAPPPATRRQQQQQQTALKGKLCEGGESGASFATHCRSFESQIRELNVQFNTVKERVGELHKDISAIRRAQNPPLSTRYEMLTRDCHLLDQSLERQQQELDRMAAIFDQSWEEQLWRLRVEQEVFSCQRADVMTLRNELKHLSNVAAQLEPYVRSLTPAQQAQQNEQVAEQAQHLQNILEHIGRLQTETGKIPRSRSRLLGQLIDKVRPVAQQLDRERSKSTSSTTAATQQQQQQQQQQAAEKPLVSSIAQQPATGGSGGNLTSGGLGKSSSKKLQQQQQQLSIERLESHIKEKIHDIMCRRPSSVTPAALTTTVHSKSDTEMSSLSVRDKLSKSDLEQIARISGGSNRRIMYKKIGKSCDKINNTSCETGGGSGGGGGSGKKCDYQRVTADGTSKAVRAMVHETRSSPSTPKCKNKAKHTPLKQQHQQHRTKPPKIYPYSDGEDNVFYSLHDSADSLSTSSRRSSVDGTGGGGGGGPDKTLVVVINRRNKSSSSANMTLAQKQRSWETFPPKRATQHHKQHVCSKLSAPATTGSRDRDIRDGHIRDSHIRDSSSRNRDIRDGGGSSHIIRDSNNIRDGHTTIRDSGIRDGTSRDGSRERRDLELASSSSVVASVVMPLRKADSFEGHEEAVKSLVAAVQETRRKPKGGGGGGGGGGLGVVMSQGVGGGGN